jgi:capsular exopolysaccharide synthesis family protein
MESYNISNLDFKNENLLKEYLTLVRTNYKFLLISNLTILIIAAVYAFTSPDIYVASSVVKVTNPVNNVLDAPSSRSVDFQFELDRRILNEIETLGNPVISQKAYQFVADTLESWRNQENKATTPKGIRNPKMQFDEMMKYLDQSKVSFDQIKDVDFIEITAESQSPQIAALLADAYANAYKMFNISENQQFFGTIKSTISEERDRKKVELEQVENKLKLFRLKGGVIQLDEQTRNLISSLSSLEAQKNASNIELSRLQESLSQYKNELRKMDPSIASYLETQSNEPYLKRLQDEIARIQTQKDIASSSSSQNSDIIKDYDSKLNDLKNKLKKAIDDYQTNILSASPAEIKSLTQKIFETETTYKSLLASNNRLSSTISGYEREFNTIPEKSVDLARLERERETLEKLYVSLDNNYQGALVNEKATPGNILIMNYANTPDKPAKPNRALILALGLIIGHSLGIGFLFLKNNLNRTVKTPDDIIHNNANVLSWIPRFNGKSVGNKNGNQLIFINDPESLATEAFRTFRTRIQNALNENKVKTILITSTAPREGKSTISSNLSVSFAKSKMRTLLIDCDLRAPSVQTLFNIKGARGLSEYLSENVDLDSCIKKSVMPNLDIIIAGKIPSDPAELLSSPQMENLVNKLKNVYDVIIVDTPPIMTVADAEIVTKYVDLSILVVSANKTELDWMKESIELLRKSKSQFYGVLLNKFNSKSTYHSYYKYYNKDYKKLKR